MKKNEGRHSGLHSEPLPPQPVLIPLLDNLPGMVYRCHFDKQRTMLFVSSGCLELTGFQPGELVDNETISYEDLILPEDRTAVLQEIESAIVEQRPFFFTYRLMTNTGQERWVLDRGEAIIATDGTVEALEGFVTDHTERMKAIELLERRVTDRTRKLSALYDILEVASDPSDLKTTISRSLRRVLKAIKGNVGAIHLFDKTGEVLQLVAHKDLPETAVAEYTKIHVQESKLFGWVVRNKEPLLISKMSEDARTISLAESSELEVYIGVPIVANDLVHGVLTVLSDDLSQYAAKEEMELLTSVGEQLGVVVENARLRSQAEQLIVLEERNRLARELHDSVTQSLYSVTLFAEAGLNLTSKGEYDRAGTLFTDVLETGQQALKEMRLLVHKLRPSILEKEGLVRALQHRLKAVEERAGIKSQLILESPLTLNAEEEQELFHVAHEALNNALKHALASQVWVYLRQDGQDGVTLKVKDNGQGFDPESAAEGSGLGLISMRERVEKLGGTISYQSAVGQGTVVQVQLPIDSIGSS